MALSYVLVALLSILLVSAFANGALEDQFRRYVRDSEQKRNLQLAEVIAGQRLPDGTWDEAGLTVIGMNALDQGMIVRVVDPSGRTIWDAAEHNNGLCRQMIVHMAANMESRYPNWKGAYTEQSYAVRSGAAQVGTAWIGYYGPFFLNDEDLAFINALNRLLLWAALATLAPAVGIGLLMARGIGAPLARVVAATQRIAGGSLDVRLPSVTRIKEIDRIASAVNELSSSLRAQETLRKRLTADMAHELRTPLSTLQSHIEAMIDGVWKPDTDRLGALHGEILRINRMVADMENLARYESGSLVLEKKDADLSALISRIVENHRPQFHSKGVELAFNRADTGGPVPAAPVMAKIDVDRISQVVINLLANALKFTPAGGSVEARVTAGSGSAEIAVSDTGCGIPAADLPLVFERLYRADSSRSRSTGGSGIGLAIAKAIVEAHGGRIWVESTPGRGSRFMVELPHAA
jgi:signal transduction histidine kinase